MALTQPFNQYLNHNAPQDYGLVFGDGTNDDKAVIDLAAENGPVFLPAGQFKYGTNDFGTPAGKRFYGPGVIQPGVNRLARNFAYLNAPPSLGDTGSIFTAFNGDFSKSLRPEAYRVGGATTLGDPSTGYVQRAEVAAAFAYARVDADAGKNVATDWTDGRTGWAFQQMKIDQFGQGDASAFTIGVDVWNNKATGTHFLAQPAGNVFNGGVTAWVDHVNINVGEFYIKGQTFDVNGTGFSIHMERNVATGAQEARWRGVSIVSEGTQAIDFAYGARGKINRGFEIGQADLGANKAAIAMSADQRVYGDVTYNNTSSANPLASGYKVFGSYGSAYYSYSSSLSLWSFNNPVLATGQFSSNNLATNNRGLNLQTQNANRFRVLIDGVVETGSGNVGSNFKVSRHSDAGTELDQPIYIVRATGDMRLGVAGASMGFFGSNGGAKPTGVAVTAAGIHAALVSLNLIAA